MMIKATLAIGLAIAAAGASATDLVIATVNNGHMIEMQKLSKFFEKDNPDIKLKWVTLEEGVLRQRLTTACAREQIVLLLAEKSLCTDNAAMIGILAERKLRLRADATPHDTDILPNWGLD